MDPRKLFKDERHNGLCVYCADQPDTRDHVPPRVLLDRPFPEQLPVVESCKACNASFSLDEQYFACILECIICGGVDISRLRRPKVREILRENEQLQKRIGKALIQNDESSSTWKLEEKRVINVLSKLAKGHFAYEQYPLFKDPSIISYELLPSLTPVQRQNFEQPPFEGKEILPEIGTRSFSRIFIDDLGKYSYQNTWITIQEGQYRYMVDDFKQPLVRIVLSEYLACEALWEF